jgi:hypothetical protein
MRRTNSKQFSPHPLDGDQPEDLFSDSAPDGDGADGLINFKRAPVGSTYWKKVTDNQHELYLKVKNDARDDDWVLLQGVIAQRVSFSDFTDGGGTSGTKDLNATIPAGCYFEKSLVTNLTGFTGDTSATLIIGVTGGDTDRYSTGTPSVFTTAAQGIDIGVPSGTRWHTAAATPTLLVTSGSDFAAVTAGALTVYLFYYGSAE